MTLLELMFATTILVMIVGALGAVANAVQQGYEYTEGYGTATQHARVVIDRITRAVNGATANEQFPGFLVVPGYEGSWRYPDTLVVWHPSGSAANPTGLPLFSELIIYCPSLSSPNSLLEIRVPSDNRTAPAVTDQTTWASELQTIKTSATAQVVTLTTYLRSCNAAISGPAKMRGAARFESHLTPSDSQWTQYKAGTLAWNQLPWVQGIYGAQTGLRQAWLRMELQFVPGPQWTSTNTAAARAVPFFGSAAVYFQLHQ